MVVPSPEMTRLLDRIRNGETEAQKELFAVVYDELKRIARGRMRDERSGHTLTPTDLVHESYTRLVRDCPVSWENRRHFFGAAVQAMRRILVDGARKRSRQKRGGEMHRVPLEEDLNLEQPPVTESVDLELLDAALTELEEKDPKLAHLFTCRYFLGWPEKKTAEELGISVRKVSGDSRLARAELERLMSEKRDA